MLSASERRMAATSAPPAKPRLHMRPDHSGHTLLDGGWWPRSGDPAVELPGLIQALDERHGLITRVMLGMADWNASRPRWLQVDGPAGSRVVKLGWFATMPAGLLTAISSTGERTDLVTIPPHASEQAASAAMRQAAQVGNRDHAPALLAAITETDKAPAHDPEAAPDHSRPVAAGQPSRLPAVAQGS